MADERLPTIPIDRCKIRGVYWVDGRNFNLGVWNGEGFIGIREKFGHDRLTEEQHHDADPMFGTVRPLVFIDFLPPEIEMETYTQVIHDGKPINCLYAPMYNYLKELPKRCQYLQSFRTL
jgi:hypothetical protein